MDLWELRVIPPSSDPNNPVSDRYLVATAMLDGGILAMDRETGTWKWLATPTGTGLSSIRGPAFSPDGSTIAFGAVRSVTTTKPKRTTYYYGVYKVSFFGGPITRVTELTNSDGYVTVNNWFIP